MKKLIKLTSSFLIVNLIFFSSNFWVYADQIDLSQAQTEEEFEQTEQDKSSESESENQDKDEEKEEKEESAEDKEAEAEGSSETQVSEEGNNDESTDPREGEGEVDEVLDEESATEDESSTEDLNNDISTEETEAGLDDLYKEQETQDQDEEKNKEEQLLNASEDDASIQLQELEEELIEESEEDRPQATNSTKLSSDSENGDEENGQNENDDDDSAAVIKSVSSDLDSDLDKEDKEGDLTVSENAEDDNLEGLDTQELKTTDSADLTNQAEQKLEVEGSSNTGSNSSISSGGNEEEAYMFTGDAIASANILNQLNLNIYRSLFETIFINIDENYKGDVDLNYIWSQLNDMQYALDDRYEELISQHSQTTAKIVNKAELNTQINLSSDTGQNQVKGDGTSTLKTGNAASLANLINLVNLSVAESIFLLSTINISNEYDGDIILPRPEKLSQWQADFLDDYFQDEENQGKLLFSEGEAKNKIISNANIAHIEEEVDTQANTGSNSSESSGDSWLETGDALVRINSTNLLNSSFFFNSWYYLLINDFGNWLGGTNLMMDGKSSPWLVDVSPHRPDSGPTSQTSNTKNISQADNQAEISTKINLSANTGLNEIEGENTYLLTGDARIAANLTNIVNSNFYRSQGFMSWINIMNGWTGNLIFAYPDLGIDLQAQLYSTDFENGTAAYKLFVSYANLGHDKAADSSLYFNAPSGTSITNSNPSADSSLANYLSWSPGALLPGQSGLKQAIVEIDLLSNQGSSQVDFFASIQTSDPEINQENNQSSLTLNLDDVLLAYNQFLDNGDQEANLIVQGEQLEAGSPLLVINSSNNSGSHILPGDTIIFEINLSNDGSGDGYDTVIIHDLYDEDFNLLASYPIPVGEIQAGREISIDFEFTLNSQAGLPEGVYYTTSQAFSVGRKGNLHESNVSSTDFFLRVARMSSGLTTQAVAAEPVDEALLFNPQPEVLGVSTTDASDDTTSSRLLLILLLLITASASWKARRLFLSDTKTLESSATG